MTLEEVARELYGLPLQEFTRTRNALAKQMRSSGDRGLAKEVGSLAKPTTAAWLVNQLVRRHGDDVDRVLSLGAQLREAQANLEGDDLKALDRERRKLTAAVTRQARALGAELGQKVSDHVAAAVEQSLRAAMADARGAAALSSGMLTDTFAATGLEEADIDGVVAVPAAVLSAPTGSRRKSRPTTERKRDRSDRGAHRKAEAALDQARQVLGRAEQAAEAVDQQAADARSRRQSLEADRERLRHQLRELGRAISGAERDESGAERQQARADRDRDSARLRTTGRERGWIVCCSRRSRGAITMPVGAGRPPVASPPARARDAWARGLGGGEVRAHPEELGCMPPLAVLERVVGGHLDDHRLEERHGDPAPPKLPIRPAGSSSGHG